MNLVAKEFLDLSARPFRTVDPERVCRRGGRTLRRDVTVNPYDPPAVARSHRAARWRCPPTNGSGGCETDARAGHGTTMRRVGRNRSSTTCPRRSGNGTRPRCSVWKTVKSRPSAAGLLSRREREGRKVAMFLDYDGTLREIVPPTRTSRGSTDDLRALLRPLSPRGKIRRSDHHQRTHPAKTWRSFSVFYSFRPDRRAWREHAAGSRPRKKWEQQDAEIGDAGSRNSCGGSCDCTRTGHARQPHGGKAHVARVALPARGRGVRRVEGASQLAEDTGSRLPPMRSVQVRHGKKIVEIVSTQVYPRGIAVRRVLDVLGPADSRSWLVLCAGDDTTDESMFALETAHVLTVKVGEGRPARVIACLTRRPCGSCCAIR